MHEQEQSYRGAAALAALHERHLRAFLDTWRRVEKRGRALPPSPDPDCATREALLAHVLGCAASYLVWICEQLDLEVPDVMPDAPQGRALGADPDDFANRVLAAWDEIVPGLSRAQVEGEAHLSRWGDPYTIDAMLEHAVMHPIRHAFQLEALLEGDATPAPSSRRRNRIEPS